MDARNALLCMAATIGLGLAPLASAQQVYRCKTAAGTTYSQQPCGGNAEEVSVRSSSTPSAPSADRNRAAIQQSTAMSGIAIRERNCLANGEAEVLRPSNARIAQLERQIAELNATRARANNNLAGATWEAGIRTQIAGLQQSVSAERTASASQITAVRQRCADARRSAEDAVRADAAAARVD